MNNIRLNKFLSQNLHISRRKADELIEKGEITVGKNKAKIGQKINNQSKISYRGKKLIFKINKKYYYALYKPRGYITSMSSQQGKAVSEFFPKNLGLFPVGRLDKYSEGLLIVTNDGNFAQKLTHPKYNKEKIYLLEYSSKPKNIGKNGIIYHFVKGVMHNNIKYSVDSAKFIGDKKIELIMHEGKSRQIRIIAGKIGLEINSLKRIAIGNLKLEDLNIKPGQIVKINPKTIL